MSEEKPRAYTAEEMAAKLVSHLKFTARYWATVKLEDDGRSDALHRVEGFLHSVLVMFDGCAAGLPAFNITPSPHPDDQKFHEDEGENWWPTDVAVNAEVSLHDMLYAEERARKCGT